MQEGEAGSSKPDSHTEQAVSKNITQFLLQVIYHLSRFHINL